MTEVTRRQLLKLSGATLADLPSVLPGIATAVAKHPHTSASKQTPNNIMPNPTGVLFQNPRVKPLSSNATFQSGCTAAFYLTGTMTLAAIYADGTLATPLANPVTADASGTFVAIYLDPTVVYRVILNTSLGALISDTDPYVSSSISGLSQSIISNLLYPQTAAELAATVAPVNKLYPPGNALRYGVDPTGVADSTSGLQNWINAAWAMYNYTDAQGLWNGGGGAIPVLVLPPGKIRVTGTVFLPTGITVTGTGHPTHTTNHTRIIMDSTGTTPGRVWSANTAIPFFGQTVPFTLNGFYFRCTTAGTTGGTEPIWNTTINGTTTDGSVVWTCIGATSLGDNRNKPIFKFRRNTVPAAGQGILANSAVTTAIQQLELWYVTLGISTFSNPLAGTGIAIGDYPLGGSLAFDVDAADFYIVDCVFQNSPCAIWAKNISTSTATRGDGFNGNRGIGVFVDRCEFDSAAVHIWVQNCFLNIFMRNSYFFQSLTRIDNCTGCVTYQDCQFYGCTIDGATSPNGLTSFQLTGNNFAGGCPVSDLLKLSLANTTTGVVNISDNMCTDANGNSTFNVTFASGGKISNNAIDSSGFNAQAGSGILSYVAAIKLVDCQNVSVQGNSITATATGGAYNGFGILTGSNARTSQNNFIDGNAVTAPYNGAPVGGQDRFINMAPGDIYGTNFNSKTSATTFSQRAVAVAQRTIITPRASVGPADHHLTINFAGTCALTLPSPSICAGRELNLRTITPNTVVSASANVVPLAGGAAGTAILAATAGKWAQLLSDGANWIITASN